MDKSWLKSLTITASSVGMVVGVGATIAGIFGYNIAPDVQADLTTLIVSIPTTVTSFLSIWGRIRAGRKMVALASLPAPQALSLLKAPLAQIEAAAR